MFNRLNVKLLFPTAVIGVLFLIISLFVFDASVDKTSVIIIILLMLVTQLLVSYMYSNSRLMQRIENLQTYMNKVVSVDEAPDSTLKDTSNDELANVGNDLCDFISNLSDVMAEIRRESDDLHQGSTHLTNKMSESVSAVDESSHQLAQMAQSIEQVASTSQVLSTSAAQVNETTSQVMSLLSQGSSSSNTNQKTLEACTREVNTTADELSLLQDECSRIGNVLDVIRGIADQTNLLALNAAIEAARAGEQGRGFAVVADEVRALAHRTQESTVEIQSMVEGLQEKSTNAVSAIGRGQSLTQESLSYSGEVVEALQKIDVVFTEVNTLTSQIANGTNEQQQSTASINDNMTAVVSLSQDINLSLSGVSEHAKHQQKTTEAVDITLKRICV